MKPTFFLALLFSIAVAKPGWTNFVKSARTRIQLPNRCKPAAIERDVLCGCHVAKLYGLLSSEYTTKCLTLFRAGKKSMKKACNFYKYNGKIRTSALINNLIYVRDKCPAIMAEADLPVANRQMLTQEEIAAILEEIQGMILDILNALNPFGPSVAPGQRMIVTGNEKVVKAAKLAAYNGITV